MRVPKPLSFVFHSVTAGLAAAFVAVLFFPELLAPSPVVQIAESQSRTSPATDAPGQAAPAPVSYSAAVARAAPAVVNVHTARVLPGSPSQGNPAPPDFFDENPLAPRRGVETSLGSGVIVSDRGHILTNHHVIAGSDRIQVMLQDGRSAEARVVGTDPDTDLAVLQVELSDLPAVTVGDSRELRVGDVVLAIGNPFGVGQAVSMGIVSATGRSRLGISTFENFIQIDAAINPGNSGGALINPQGELIGINTAIFSRTGGSQGIGFAIPVTLARDVMRQIIEHGYVVRGWLGIEVQELTPALAESFQLQSVDGVLIASVLGDSPAQAAGLRPGDVITRVDGQAVSGPRAALDTIAGIPPGTRVELELVREGRRQSAYVSVAQRPAEPLRPRG